uniref:Chlororespiratory reduction 4 n=1 Tax=Kalanchoe fedtschenkoi TaxID=63787 RepID=A0A7N0VKM1_KALFE
MLTKFNPGHKNLSMSVKPFITPLHILIEDKFISLLQSSCKTLRHLHQIWAQIITHGIQHSEYVAPRLVSACAQLDRMPLAVQFFRQLPHPNVMLCNAMLRGYLRNDSCEDVLRLFSHMKTAAIQPNCFTYPFVLRSCVKISALREGEQVYSDLTKTGFKSNSFVGTTLIDMYAKEKLTRYAHKIFAEMLEKNVVAWTSMIRAYLSVGNIHSARGLFDLAPDRDVILWNIMISGYIETGDMASAQILFDKFPNRDVMSWNTMLNGYAKSGNIAACEKLFEEMPARNVLSWNGLIGAYAHSGLRFKVLDSFKRMLLESDALPNDATLVTVLSECSKLGALDLGKWVHVYAENNALGTNVYVQNALIDMYAKCGVVESAMEVFSNMTVKDIISWNTIIGGLAIHGRGINALELFNQMIRAKEKPDGITFLGVLCACMHMGLVEDGLLYFQSMVDDYSVVPQIEHYGCIVDLLARSGFVARALEFIMKMPMQADAVIWATLLGASRTYKNIQVAELALERLAELEPTNPANYVMLSNVYRDAARWKDVARLKVAVRDTGSKKVPGCSLVEIDDAVVEFFALDERHPKSHEIYVCLRGLTNLLRMSGYAPDLRRLGR